MLRNKFLSIAGDVASPTWEAIKWQAFAQGIVLLSQLETNAEDVIMYLPAAISSIHSLLDEEKGPQLALHSALTTIHNLAGHRFLPYVDPKTGFHCTLPPTTDVFFHACMLGFVDDAVQNKFPTKSLNQAYDLLTLLMKAGIAYSLYLSFIMGVDADACKAFIPWLAYSSVPAGTAFSLLSMLNFPFDHPEKYTQQQLLAYTAVMYIVSISAGIGLLYEFSMGNKFEREGAGKYFESYFIAGASLQGLNLIGDFLWEKISRFTKIPEPVQSITTSTATVFKAMKAKPATSIVDSDKNVKSDNNSQTQKSTVPPVPRVSFCHRLGKFAMNVGSVVCASLALNHYMSPKP